MRKVYSKDGTPIAFDEYGQGVPIILVGGAFQHRLIDPGTAKLAEKLGQHFKVFHYDRRGRGDSGDTLPYAVEREVEDIDALIQDAGGSAFVFGMSSGAVLALHAAAHGLAIKKLALYEAPFNLEPGGLEMSLNYSKKLKEILSENRRGDAVAHFMVLVGTPAEAVAGMRQSPAWANLEAVAPTLGYDDAVMGDSQIPTQKFASITIPTLVVYGGDTSPLLRNAATTVAKVLPNAQARTLEGQTHNVDPDVLAPVLDAWFGA